MTEQPNRICILGGGFGGLYTALRLSRLPWQQPEQPEIVLVDQRDRFLFSPLLYELITGELQDWEIAPSFEQLLQETNIRFHQGTVKQINSDARQVHLTDNTELSYDYLVLAMGGETPLEIVPGAAEYAIPFRTIEDAHRLEERLRILEASQADKIRVAVVGAGYSGVELACKLADRLQARGRLRVIERSDGILRGSPEFNRDAAQKALQERQIWLDLETSVQSITPETLTLEYRGQVDEIPVDVVLCTVGTRVADVINSLSMPKNERDQLLTSPTLQVLEHPEIFALGDAASCKDVQGQQVPNTAQAALQQADYVGWNIWASITHRPLLPFRYQSLGEMMTLGVDNATLTGLGVKLEGQLAHLARRLVYLYRLPTLEHQVKVAFNWMTRPLQELMTQR
ncbi:MAG: NAD(P)/FAD-dependent oxidoreductase [Microcoleaceae cyanobacterium]